MTARPVRVLVVAPSLRITGGQSVQAVRLVDTLRAQPGITADLLEVDPKLPGPLSALQRIKYVRTAVTEAAYALQLLARVPQYDVIHAFSAGYWSFVLAPYPAILAARAFGRKSILNYRNGTLEDHLRRFPRAVAQMARADRIVTPSGFLVDVYGRHGLPATAIYNVIDSASFPFRVRDPVRPRFFHNRGFETLYNVECTLRAFARIQQAYPHASLRLAHDGPLRAQMEALTRELKLAHVEFVGSVDQRRMKELYDDADIYLMSPNYDNMPGSVLECYACGLPLVSTAAGGVPYIVEHDRTGLLVPVGDHVAMADAALRLLQEPGLAAALARAGKAECAKYTSEAVGSAWAAFYQDLLRDSRAA
jgi:L-malate glycosyltransferase